MKPVIVGSIALNLILLGALAYVRQPRPSIAVPSSGELVIAERPQPKLPRRAGSQTARIENSGNPGGFHWSSVESPDFQKYIENLREVGCPEETIRDLIVAEVNKLFAPKFAALGAQAQQEYWKAMNRKKKEELQTQVQALRKEKKELLTTLLGIDSDPTEKYASATLESLTEQARFSFLPAEKQKLVKDIFDKYAELQKSGSDDGLGSDGLDSRKLREQRRQELASVLSSEELNELDLRDSNTSNSIRSRFASADLSEQEYRKLFDLRKAYEAEQGFAPDRNDPEKMKARSEARKALEDSYRAALGEDRFAEMQRQQDPAWRGLNQVAQQHNLSPQTLAQAYDVQRQAGEKMSQLFSEGPGNRENSRQVVQQIAAETEKTLRSMLGDTAYEEYRKSSPQFSFSRGGDSMTVTIPPGQGGVMFDSRSESGGGADGTSGRIRRRIVEAGPGEVIRLPPPPSGAN